MRPCSSCRSTDLVRVWLTLGGAPVVFSHCRSCEHRVWLDTQADAPLAIGDVLQRAAA